MGSSPISDAALCVASGTASLRTLLSDSTDVFFEGTRPDDRKEWRVGNESNFERVPQDVQTVSQFEEWLRARVKPRSEASETADSPPDPTDSAAHTRRRQAETTVKLLAIGQDFARRQSRAYRRPTVRRTTGRRAAPRRASLKRVARGGRKAARASGDSAEPPPPVGGLPSAPVARRIALTTCGTAAGGRNHA